MNVRVQNAGLREGREVKTGQGGRRKKNVRKVLKLHCQLTATSLTDIERTQTPIFS